MHLRAFQCVRWVAALVVVVLAFGVNAQSVPAKTTSKTKVVVASKKPVILKKPVVASVKKKRTMKPSANVLVRSSKKNVSKIKGDRSVAPTRLSRRRSDIVPVVGADDGHLSLRSNAVLVVDQDTKEVLIDKNASQVLPIASLTKIMTALVVLESGASLNELITVTEADVDTLKNSSSRLSVGAQLTREELLHLALMSSENRAAHALARASVDGFSAFVHKMNQKARQIGMADTRYVDSTGLSPANHSTAKDLSLLVAYAYQKPLIRSLSTSENLDVYTGVRTVHYKNTNKLVGQPDWDIGLQKTGYISEAGRCLMMQVRIGGRKLIMVFLDSAGKLSRLADAENVRRWVEMGRF